MVYHSFGIKHTIQQELKDLLWIVNAGGGNPRRFCLFYYKEYFLWICERKNHIYWIQPVTQLNILIHTNLVLLFGFAFPKLCRHLYHQFHSNMCYKWMDIFILLFLMRWWQWWRSSSGRNPSKNNIYNLFHIVEDFCIWPI